MRLLAEMNVVSVGMGLESGSQRVLQYLKGKNSGIEENRSAIRMLKKYKIAANASFIMGCPDETREEILETLDFIKKSDLDLFDVYVLTPFPGTPTWTYALERGLVSEEMDWDRLNVTFASHHKKAIILSEVLTREELHRLFQEFRKLQFCMIGKNILRHPFLMDIPRMVGNKLIEKSCQAVSFLVGKK
ncbi:MAG: radical SAM protein [Armatimonadetes bacterium]|nr:radical SAM protein [Armatimonadota bacterium]